jgi:hypothetical protein
VNSTQERLRDAFRADAEAIGPETMRALGTARDPEPIRLAGPGDRRRRGRPGRIRRIGFPVAAAAAVTGIVVLAAVLVPRALSQRASHATGANTGGAAAGHRSGGVAAPPYPAFFVAANPDSNRLEVRRATTGALAATVRAPAGVTFASVGTGDSQTFVVAAWPGSGCRTLLYEFRLGAAGRPGPLTPFGGGSVPGDISTNIAVGASDHVIAYGADSCGRPNHPTAGLRVTDLATGHTTRWSFPDQQDVGSLSLSADGSELGYIVDETKLFPSIAAVVPVGAGSGTLAGRSHIVEPARSLTNISSAVLSPDGKTLWSVSDRTGAATASPPSMNLNETIVSSGVRQPSRTLPGGAFGVWAAPGGGWLLVQRELGSYMSAPRLDRVNENGDELHPLQGAWLGPDRGADIAW